MIGVVVCGGQSSRMGRDKGLLIADGQTWAVVAAGKITQLSVPVVVSINKTQVLSYSSSFPEMQRVVDNDTLNVKGPLLGLLSVHQKFPEEDLFLLACDLKDMIPSLMRNLLASFVRTNTDAAVYTTENGPQPLCGIYSNGGLKKIEVMRQAGELKKFSMIHMLAAITTLYVPSAKEDEVHFKNYNSPEDF